MQASVRSLDRVVIQTGVSLGPLNGCEIDELSAATINALSAAFSQPHGNVYLAVDGTVTFDPFVASPPPPPPADQTAFDNAVALLRSTFGTTRTAAQANACIDAITVILRRMWIQLQ